MKAPRFLLILLLILPVLVAAQNVAITNDGSSPDNSAMLDIKSNSKGLLIPRLTTLERASIASPAVGLLVHDISTFTFWYYAGDVNGGWLELQTGLTKHWNISGNNIFNTNTGNVGIGTNNPAEKMVINGTDPALQFLNAGAAKGFLQASGNDIKTGTYLSNATGKLVFSTRAVDRMWITENGLTGIGTATPSGILTLNATNPTMQIRTGEVNKGYLQVINNDFKIGTNATNTTGNLIFNTRAIDRMWISENGQVGIGTATPSSVLTINGTNPILQLRNEETDIGFVQLSNDDIRIGTNITNTTGHFVVRTNGADRLWVNDNGQVGIGTATPTSELTINGASPAIVLRALGLQAGSISASGGNFSVGSTGIASRLILSGNGINSVYVHPNGNVSLGSIAATGYRFSVDGRIICSDITVLPFDDWPDYVFEKNYRLQPLSELEQYIQRYKHLPGIPTAANINENGIAVGEMQRRLIEKIEELTLYIIDLNHKNEALAREIKKLKK